jgi:signal transduction histidine kinase
MIMARSITHIIKYEQLKLQNHFLEMLTATISHDMRTPLNAILGIGKNLEPHVTHEAGTRYLQIMMNSASLLHFLVNDLLDLFRIKNGKFSKYETKVDIRQHLNELIDIFQL